MAKAKKALAKPQLASVAATEFAQGRTATRRKPAADLSPVSRFPPEGSTRLTVNMSKELHKRLKHAAVDKGIPVGQIIESLVAQYVAKG